MRIEGPVTGIALALLLAGCPAGDGNGDTDAGAGDSGAGDAGLGIDPPIPPEPPALPIMTPCPTGWREVQDPDVPELVTCDPWPEGGPEDCGVDEAHFPGEPGCQRIGTACPAGDWAEDIPPESTVRYVKPDAPVGGTCTRDDPCRTIARALAMAHEGDVIALSKGTFDEEVGLATAVTLWGACVAETIVAPSVPSGTATIQLEGRAPVVRNLSVSGVNVAILVVGSEQAAELESVAVYGVPGGIFAIAGGVLTARNVVVRDVSSTAPEATGGVLLQEGATVHLARVAVEEVEGSGVRAFDADDVLVAEDLSVRAASAGVLLLGGSLGQLARAAFTGNDYGVVAQDEETELEAIDVSATDTGSSSGLRITDGAHATVSRVGLFRSSGVGLAVMGAGSQIDGSDVVAAETLVPADFDGGYGISVAEGSRAELERTWIGRSSMVGLQVAGVGTELVATDVSVVSTQLGLVSWGDLGDGVEVAAGSRLELHRARIVDFEKNGLIVDGVLSATDISIAGGAATSAQSLSGEYGVGLHIQLGGQAEIERLELDGNSHTAIAVGSDGSSLLATDLSVTNTRSTTGGGLFGNGLVAALGSAVTLHRARFSGNRVVAISAGNPGTVVRAEDLVVERTLEQGCVVDWCPDEGFGFGIFALDGAHVEVTRFVVSDNALSGIVIAEDGSIDLHDGLVTRNPIGLNLEVEGYDLSRLQDEVFYVDNERNFDSSELPLPEVFDEFPAPAD